jgi:BED zinc finger
MVQQYINGVRVKTDDASVVENHFAIDQKKGKECDYCHKVMGMGSGSTSLRYHMWSQHAGIASKREGEGKGEGGRRFCSC